MLRAPCPLPRAQVIYRIATCAMHVHVTCAMHVYAACLEVVDLLGELQRLSPALEGLGPQPVGEVAHLLQHEIL